jgi:uncharacterized protein YbjT (DUF2867 family)
VILFGATGMVGSGVLRECLLDPGVTKVLAVGRRPSGMQHPKLEELVHGDFTNFDAVEERFANWNACFFCVGVSSAGMSEAEYRRITYDATLAAARAVVKRSPDMTFVYVSGAGTDGTERSPSMWAGVRGETENALLALPLKGAYMFRAGWYIQPMHGVTSRTPLYRAFYAVMGWLYPLLKVLAPKYVTSTERVGRAMLTIAHHGGPSRVLENYEINELAH